MFENFPGRGAQQIEKRDEPAQEEPKKRALQRAKSWPELHIRKAAAQGARAAASM
jgi:hypothetical protein